MENLRNCLVLAVFNAGNEKDLVIGEAGDGSMFWVKVPTGIYTIGCALPEADMYCFSTLSEEAQQYVLDELAQIPKENLDALRGENWDW